MSVNDHLEGILSDFEAPGGRKRLAFLLPRRRAANDGSEFDFQMCRSRGGLLSREGRQSVPVRNAVGRDERCLHGES
ncbi:uncharacterized [Tachysurus ichikawai]